MQCYMNATVQMLFLATLTPYPNPFTFFVGDFLFLGAARFLFGADGTPSGLPRNMYSDAWNQRLGADLFLALAFFLAATGARFFLSLAPLSCIERKCVRVCA